MVPPGDDAELCAAGLAHGDPLVRYPDRGRVTEGPTQPSHGVQLGGAHEGGLLGRVVLDSSVYRLQPGVPLGNCPERRRKYLFI